MTMAKQTKARRGARMGSQGSTRTASKAAEAERTRSTAVSSRPRAMRRRRTQPAKGAVKATIRHYCQGIGDCHLIRFTKDNGEDFWMLIDCGVHTAVTGGVNKIDAIVDDIRSRTKRL